MSHIRFDEDGVPVVVDEPTRSVFAELQRSRTSLRDAIAEATRDPARCLGRFVVLETVERSAVGALHQAWDTDEQRFVAVRTVDGVGALSREAQRAIETATLLRHPNILAPSPGGFGVALDGRLFLASEIAPGRTLEPRRGEDGLHESSAWCGLGKPLAGPAGTVGHPSSDPARVPRGPLASCSGAPTDVAAALVRDLARGLVYAQSLGLVHGAIHPASVLVDGRGQARLIDWGVAVAEAGSPLRRTALLKRLEQRGCRPPELIEGEVGDTLADVYGLGALLLRLTTGKTPSALSPEHDGPDPALPPTLDPVVRRCVDPDPQRRYASAIAVARDLDRWLQGERPEACAVPLGRRLGRCWRQVRGAVGRMAEELRARSSSAAGPERASDVA